MGIVRHTSVRDSFRILIVNSAGSAVFVMINVVSAGFFGVSTIIPNSIVLIDLITSVYLMTSLRLVVKFIYAELTHPERYSKKVLILGSSELAIMARRAFDLDEENNYKIVGYVETNRHKSGKKMGGIQIYPYTEVKTLLEKHHISLFVIATPGVSSKIRKQIIQTCIDKGVQVKTVPSIRSWLDNDLQTKHLKNIHIEDLLERNPIYLSNGKLKKQLYNRTIMVTGAAGSIGSEIVRQLCRYPIDRIVLVDQAETPLYNMELELSQFQDPVVYHNILADITDDCRMDTIFKEFQPDIVYHAAAYKHVPVMEDNPQEAVRNNVIGTKILADLSIKHDVKTFIMISSDKAVNPTNVMGATKRAAEIYIQSLNNNISRTRFITTRFGNVLGSNGSVISLFKEQIDKGGPVTVTHPDINRYFMTISEACQLVLEAASMGNGGEIFVFDMGKSVKIVNLARNMIKLSGYEPDVDIEIKFIGLRPGEKIFEELIYSTENNIPTYHPKILIAHVQEYDHEWIQARMKRFKQALKNQNDSELVMQLKETIPEFKSNNSVYEKLDKKISAV
ncbi:MAG: nucleoside-diphosphate sugar epimerase/dehydratase [Bacteroidales bacterium]